MLPSDAKQIDILDRWTELVKKNTVSVINSRTNPTSSPRPCGFAFAMNSLTGWNLSSKLKEKFISQQLSAHMIVNLSLFHIPSHAYFGRRISSRKIPVFDFSAQSSRSSISLNDIPLAFVSYWKSRIVDSSCVLVVEVNLETTKSNSDLPPEIISIGWAIVDCFGIAKLPEVTSDQSADAVPNNKSQSLFIGNSRMLLSSGLTTGYPISAVRVSCQLYSHTNLVESPVRDLLDDNELVSDLESVPGAQSTDVDSCSLGMRLVPPAMICVPSYFAAPDSSRSVRFDVIELEVDIHDRLLFEAELISSLEALSLTSIVSRQVRVCYHNSHAIIGSVVTIPLIASISNPPDDEDDILKCPAGQDRIRLRLLQNHHPDICLLISVEYLLSSSSSSSQVVVIGSTAVFPFCDGHLSLKYQFNETEYDPESANQVRRLMGPEYSKLISPPIADSTCDMLYSAVRHGSSSSSSVMRHVRAPSKQTKQQIQDDMDLKDDNDMLVSFDLKAFNEKNVELSDSLPSRTAPSKLSVDINNNMKMNSKISEVMLESKTSDVSNSKLNDNPMAESKLSISSRPPLVPTQLKEDVVVTTQQAQRLPLIRLDDDDGDDDILMRSIEDSFKLRTSSSFPISSSFRQQDQSPFAQTHQQQAVSLQERLTLPSDVLTTPKQLDLTSEAVPFSTVGIVSDYRRNKNDATSSTTSVPVIIASSHKEEEDVDRRRRETMPARSLIKPDTNIINNDQLGWRLMTRACKSRLSRLGVMDQLDMPSSGSVPLSIGEDLRLQLHVEKELSDVNRMRNDVTIQFASCQLSSELQSHPARIFFSFHFYTFSSSSSRRRVLDDRMHGQVHLCHPPLELSDVCSLSNCSSLSSVEIEPMEEKNNNNTSNFIISSSSSSNSLSKRYSFTIDHSLDPNPHASIKHYNDYLAHHMLFVEVWDADSLFCLGCMSIPLFQLLRQGLPVVTSALECDLTSCNYECDSGACTNVTEGSCIVGRVTGKFHVILTNIGQEGQEALSTRTSSSELTANQLEMESRLRQSSLDCSKHKHQQKVRVKKLSEVDQEVNVLIKGLTQTTDMKEPVASPASSPSVPDDAMILSYDELLAIFRRFRLSAASSDRLICWNKDLLKLLNIVTYSGSLRRLASQIFFLQATSLTDFAAYIVSMTVNTKERSVRSVIPSSELKNVLTQYGVHSSTSITQSPPFLMNHSLSRQHLLVIIRHYDAEGCDQIDVRRLIEDVEELIATTWWYKLSKVLSRCAYLCKLANRNQNSDLEHADAAGGVATLESSASSILLSNFIARSSANPDECSCKENGDVLVTSDCFSFILTQLLTQYLPQECLINKKDLEGPFPGTSDSIARAIKCIEKRFQRKRFASSSAVRPSNWASLSLFSSAIGESGSDQIPPTLSSNLQQQQTSIQLFEEPITIEQIRNGIAMSEELNLFSQNFKKYSFADFVHCLSDLDRSSITFKQLIRLLNCVGIVECVSLTKDSYEAHSRSIVNFLARGFTGNQLFFSFQKLSELLTLPSIANDNPLSLLIRKIVFIIQTKQFDINQFINQAQEHAMLTRSADNNNDGDTVIKKVIRKIVEHVNELIDPSSIVAVDDAIVDQMQTQIKSLAGSIVPLDASILTTQLQSLIDQARLLQQDLTMIEERVLLVRKIRSSSVDDSEIRAKCSKLESCLNRIAPGFIEQQASNTIDNLTARETDLVRVLQTASSGFSDLSEEEANKFARHVFGSLLAAKMSDTGAQVSSSLPQRFPVKTIADFVLKLLMPVHGSVISSCTTASAIVSSSSSSSDVRSNTNECDDSSAYEFSPDIFVKSVEKKLRSAACILARKGVDFEGLFLQKDPKETGLISRGDFQSLLSEVGFSLSSPSVKSTASSDNTAIMRENQLRALSSSAINANTSSSYQDSREEGLHIIRQHRNQKKKKMMIDQLMSAFVSHVSIVAHFAQPYFFEHDLTNPYNCECRFQIEIFNDDLNEAAASNYNMTRCEVSTDLRVVHSSADWAFLRQNIGSLTSSSASRTTNDIEEDMFDIEEKPGRKMIFVTLGKNETIRIPFVFISYDIHQSRRMSGSGKSILGEKTPDRCVIARFASVNHGNQIVSVCRLAVELMVMRDGCCLPVDRRLRLFQEQDSFCKRSFKFSSLPTASDQRLFFNGKNLSSSRKCKGDVFVKCIHVSKNCSNGKMSLEWVRDYDTIDNNSSYELHIRNRTGPTSEHTRDDDARISFLLLFFSDPNSIILRECWAVSIDSIVGLQSHSMIGRTSIIDLAIAQQDWNASDRVRLFTKSAVCDTMPGCAVASNSLVDVTIVPSEEFRLIEGVRNSVKLNILPKTILSDHSYNFLVHLVNVRDMQVFMTWLVAVTSAPPSNVSSTVMVQAPIDSSRMRSSNSVSREVSKKILFVNQWDEERQFFFISSDPNLISLKTESLVLGPKQQGQIRTVVRWASYGNEDDKEAFVFVHDGKNRFEEAFKFIISAARL